MALCTSYRRLLPYFQLPIIRSYLTSPIPTSDSDMRDSTLPDSGSRSFVARKSGREVIDVDQDAWVARRICTWELNQRRRRSLASADYIYLSASNIELRSSSRAGYMQGNLFTSE